MGSFFLQEGLVIHRLGEYLEYSGRCGSELYFEAPATGQRLTLKETQFWGELQTKTLNIVDAFSSPNLLAIPPESQSLQFKNLEDLNQKYFDDLERKIIYITKLREAGITQGQTRLIESEAKRIHRLILEEAKKNKKVLVGDTSVPGTSTIQKWWKNLSKHNYEVYAIINGNAYRRRKILLDEKSEQFLQEQIDQKYAIDTRPSATGAYKDYKDELVKKNEELTASGQGMLTLASERTFSARIDARPKKEIMVARLGREAARRHFKMIRGHLPSKHPLDVVEIDHTPMNLYVLDDQSFLPLGRPWLTAIKDRNTGMLLGFYVSFQATGLDSIFGAIKHSLSSHYLAYELWTDIENPWAAFGRGLYYESDRGPDFISPRYQKAITSIGSFYEYCERRTPWLKGSIERFFLTLEQTFFECMKGRTFASLEKRGDYDPVKDSVVRFSTLIYLLHKWAADYHNVFTNNRKQASPLELWNEGIGIAPPPYPSDPDQLNIILGEHNTGKVSQEGIRYKWLTFADDQLSGVMDLVGQGTKLDYVVSREDLGQIHVKHPRTNEYFVVPSTRPEYSSGLSLFQHKYIRHAVNVDMKKETAIDILIETRASIQETLGEELAAKQNAKKAQLARIAGINSNSVLEGKNKTILNPFQGQTVESHKSTLQQIITPPFTNVPKYTWGN